MRKTSQSTPGSQRRESAAVRKLHDSLCQTLTGLHLFTNVLVRRAKKVHPDLVADMENLHTLVDRARDECHEVLDELRKEDRRAKTKKRSQVFPSR